MHYKNLNHKSKIKEEFASLHIQYDETYEVAWAKMGVYPRPCFTPELVDGLQRWLDAMLAEEHVIYSKMKYIVTASSIPNVFCLGGDLTLFLEYIRQGDRAGMLQYNEACIQALFLMHTGPGKDLTTIALVQGDALGGGLEAALAHDVIIAERSARMGLPDILFNLFPGAGAYSFLARKIGALKAERMVLDGKLYTANEMYDLGVVDILVEDGQGEQAVYAYIKQENRQRNGRRAFRRSKRLYNPILLPELLGMASVWADAAMRLEARDLRMMERLVKRQTIKFMAD